MSRIKEQIVQSIDFVNKTFVDKNGVTKPFEPDNAYLLKNGAGTHDRYVTDHESNISVQSSQRTEIAYQHSQTNGNPHGTTASDIGAYTTSQVNNLLTLKVNTEAGKGLSEENYTTLEKNKLESIQLEQLDHGIIFDKTLATTITINNATPVDLTPLICGGVTPLNEGSPFYYDSVNNLIRCSNLTQKYFSINIILLLSGTITSGGNNDIFLVTLHRPNDAVFRRFLYNSELTTETFSSKQVCVLSSYVQSGGNDNFQLPVGATTGGFRIKISRINGNAVMTLDTNNQQSIRLLT